VHLSEHGGRRGGHRGRAADAEFGWSRGDEDYQQDNDDCYSEEDFQEHNKRLRVRFATREFIGPRKARKDTKLSGFKRESLARSLVSSFVYFCVYCGNLTSGFCQV